MTTYDNPAQAGRWTCCVTESVYNQPTYLVCFAYAGNLDDRSELMEFDEMNQYPPYQEDPRYPHQNNPTNQQHSRGNPEWHNSGWGSQQSQPQANDPYGPADSHGQYGQYSQYGQYGPPSQQPQPGYGPFGDQGQYGQYGQYGSPSQHSQSQQGWGYGAPTPPSQQGAYGQYGQYGAPSQQSPYMPNAAPPPYDYPVPGQQELDYGYDDALPRKSRKGIYTILSIFAVIVVLMVACGVFANLPGPSPEQTASIAGTWYGRANVLESSGTVATEAIMDLTQTSTSVTGTGKLCVNRRSSAFEYVNITIDGSMSGNNATVTWHTDNLTNGIKGDHELTGTLSKGTLNLIYQDGGSNVTLAATKGTRQQYLAACRQLPGS